MYAGDIRLGDTLHIKYTTVNTSGVPTTLAGTPVVSAYPGNSVTQLTAGITLTVDFDAVTGLNDVTVVASSGNGYATATNYTLVITTGTVSGSSVVGYVVGSFSIENRSAVMPTTAARTLDVSAAGEAGLDWANIGAPTTTQTLSGTTIGTATALGANAVTAAVIATDAIDADAIALTAANEILGATSGTADSGSTTTIVDAERTEADTDYWVGSRVTFTSGTLNGQTRLITAFNAATDTITFAPATTVAVATHTYRILPAARGDVHFWLGSLVNALVSGRVDSSTGAMAADVVTAAAIANGAIDAATFATGAIDNAAFNVTETLTANPAAGGITTASFAAGAIDNAAFNVTETLTANPATGGIVAASFGAGAIDATAIAANAITAAKIATDAITSTQLAQSAADKIIQAVSGTTDSGSTTTIVDAERTEADTDYWAGSAVLVTSGPNVGQIRRISAFNAATDTITVANAFTQAMAVGNTYLILRASGMEAPGAGATDWTAAERNQMRHRLGIDGTTAAPAVTVHPSLRTLASGTSDSGTTTTMVDAARTEADTDYWKGSWIAFTSGTLLGQARLITAFNAATDTITFTPATTVTVGTQEYEILPAGAVDIGLWNGTAPNNLISGRVDTSTGAMAANVMTAAAAAADLTTELQAGLATSAALATVQTDTDDIQTRLPTTLSSGRMRTDVEAVGANATAATTLRQALISSTTGAAVAGTLSTTQMTTDVTGQGDSTFNGRLLTFITGTLTFEQTEITAYSSVTGLFTFIAVTVAPSIGDTFVIT